MNEIIDIDLKSKIAPPFYKLHHHILKNNYSEYWLKGGRGSTKSSFISLEIILRMNRSSKSNAIIVMKTADLLRDSVVQQMQWAINVLGQKKIWKPYISPMMFKNVVTGQKILFKGLYDSGKTKGVKNADGEYDIVWYEELSTFKNMIEVDEATNSYIRGSENPIIFYSYNPPQNKSNWVNAESLVVKENRLVHSSSYLDIPEHLREKWLGKIWIDKAEYTKKVNYKKYEHVYLGISNGTGGEVFNNVSLRTITDEERNGFCNIIRGIDWGFAVDPFVYGVMEFDTKHKKLYIFKEIYKVGYKNRHAIEMLKKEKYNDWIIADSSEPKSIIEFRDSGLLIRGAIKGPGSVEYGIKYLADLEEIIIDHATCSNAAREFSGYELEPDGFGSFKSSYPDKNNHWIDCARYALESKMREANRM